jgi:tripartite-type tricarboxylate transporter receptor subunit TctC
MKWRHVGLLLLAVTGFAGPARADTYPSKPIRLIVPFVPGGAVDTLARQIGNKLSEDLGQPVIVENRGGAGGNLGADVVAKSPPDGYTMLLTTTGHAISASLYRTLPFDPLKDFIPVTQVIASRFVLLASTKIPVTSTQDLIALAKSKPGGLNYGSSGVGGPLHLAMEVFKSSAGVDMLHVPYRGDALLYAALIAGEIQAAMAPESSALPHIQAGTIRGLGVTGTTRSPTLPDVPTLKEAGVAGLEASSWQGLFLPANTPPAIVHTLQRAVAKALATPDVRNRILALGGQEPVGNTPEEFGALFKTEVARFSRIIEGAKIPKVN